MVHVSTNEKGLLHMHLKGEKKKKKTCQWLILNTYFALPFAHLQYTLSALLWRYQLDMTNTNTNPFP